MNFSSNYGVVLRALLLALLPLALLVAGSAWWWSKDGAPRVSPETRALWDAPPGRVELLRAAAADLEHLAEPQTVRELFLDAPQLTAQQYAGLARFTALEHLRIRGAALPDAAAAHVAQLQQLRYLNIPQAELSDAGARALAELPLLELLRFGSQRLSRRGIAAIAALPRLRFLHLIDVPLDDAALEPLYSHTRLESLYIDGARLSDAGVERLLKALPEVHLHIDQQHHDRDPQRHDHAAPTAQQVGVLSNDRSG